MQIHRPRTGKRTQVDNCGINCVFYVNSFVYEIHVDLSSIELENVSKPTVYNGFGFIRKLIQSLKEIMLLTEIGFVEQVKRSDFKIGNCA